MRGDLTVEPQKQQKAPRTFSVELLVWVKGSHITAAQGLYRTTQSLRLDLPDDTAQ